jgi:DNA topoisomerase-1
VRVVGDTVKLNFDGKSGVRWERDLKDPKLAKLLKARLGDLKGPHARVFDVHADDVNAYLKPFKATAKKFRTFHATRLARAELLLHKGAPPEQREKIVTQMFVHVAAQLGHTPAVDRESYVDPMVVRAFVKGRLT